MNNAYETRKWERRKVFEAMRARRENGEDLGVVAEVGIKGLCIRGQRRLAIGELVTLRIDLPPSLAEMSPFVVEAECRWSDAQGDEGMYDSGFKFRVESPEQIELLRKVLDTCTHRY